MEPLVHRIEEQRLPGCASTWDQQLNLHPNATIFIQRATADFHTVYPRGASGFLILEGHLHGRKCTFVVLTVIATTIIDDV